MGRHPFALDNPWGVRVLELQALPDVPRGLPGWHLNVRLKKCYENRPVHPLAPPAPTTEATSTSAAAGKSDGSEILKCETPVASTCSDGSGSATMRPSASSRFSTSSSLMHAARARKSLKKASRAVVRALRWQKQPDVDEREAAQPEKPDIAVSLQPVAGLMRVVHVHRRVRPNSSFGCAELSQHLRQACCEPWPTLRGYLSSPPVACTFSPHQVRS